MRQALDLCAYNIVKQSLANSAPPAGGDEGGDDEGGTAPAAAGSPAPPASQTSPAPPAPPTFLAPPLASPVPGPELHQRTLQFHPTRCTSQLEPEFKHLSGGPQTVCVEMRNGSVTESSTRPASARSVLTYVLAQYLRLGSTCAGHGSHILASRHTTRGS